MKVSVGLAVYNAECYLEQCLDSLTKQTCEDLEIIIIDDGSTDSSGAICDRYAVLNSRMRVIHKPNGGLASARQAALEASTGDYFCVCDADDWMEPEMYERLLNKAIETDADIVMCGSWREYGDTSQTSVYRNIIPTDNKGVIKDMLNGRFPCSIWNKLFRRDLFEKYRLSWEPGIDMGEDLLMMLKFLLYPVKLVCLQEPFYHYRRIQGGNNYTSHVTLNSYRQLLFIEDWIDEHMKSDVYSEGKTHFQINVAYAGLRVESGMTPTYYRKTATSRINLKKLIAEWTLKSMLILLAKLFGYRFGSFVNRLFYKMVYK